MTPLDQRFWVIHLAAPLAAMVAALLAIHVGHVDFRVASWFYDPVLQGFPARDAYLAKKIFHDGGNGLIHAIAIGAFLLFLASHVGGVSRAAGRAGLYVVLCIAVTTGLAALGKQVTNMDCPWALADFGGNRPYVSLFSPRPDHLPRGACFPGAHSSGAFALFALYFLWRESRPRRACVALGGVALLGAIFSATQWARGAHFVSHDAWSALLAWGVCLACYVSFARGWFVPVRARS